MSELKETLKNIAEEKRNKIIPENIKEGIEIFDVVGNYSGLDTSDANATSEDIISGKTAYVNGEKVTGQIASYTGSTYGTKFREVGQNASQGYISLFPPKGYFNGTTARATYYFPNQAGWWNATEEQKRFASELLALLGLTSEKIKVGTVVMTMSGKFTSDADATELDIAEGKTAYVKGQKITGILKKESTDPELEGSFLSLIDSSLGANVTKFPASLTVIGNYAFSGKTNLAITELPEGITQIGTASFEDCKGLTTMKLPTTLVTIGQAAFYNCSKLSEVTCLGDVSVIDRNAFNNSGLKKLIMPNITKLVSLGHSNAFSATNITTGGIYVPDELVATFKAATSTNWSYYVDNIKPISEL